MKPFLLLMLSAGLAHVTNANEPGEFLAFQPADPAPDSIFVEGSEILPQRVCINGVCYAEPMQTISTPIIQPKLTVETEPVAVESSVSTVASYGSRGTASFGSRGFSYGSQGHSMWAPATISRSFTYAGPGVYTARAAVHQRPARRALLRAALVATTPLRTMRTRIRNRICN